MGIPTKRLKSTWDIGNDGARVNGIYESEHIR